MKREPIRAGPEPARAWLRRRLLRAESVSIAAGYLSLKGLRGLLEVLRPLILEQGVRCRVLYGRFYDQALDRYVLRVVRRMEREHGGRLAIRGAARPVSAQNLYLIERPAGAIALVGPSTLTGAGLDRSVARSDAIEDPAAVAELRARFEAAWAEAPPLPDPPAPSGDAREVLDALGDALQRSALVARAPRDIALDSPWGRLVPEANRGRLPRAKAARQARLELARPPEVRGILDDASPEAEARRRDLVALLVAAASAPRRSLRERHQPQAALALCLLPDRSLERAAALHDWALLRHNPEVLSQIGLFSNASLQEALAKLDAELREIQLWYALELEEALAQYAELIGGT